MRPLLLFKTPATRKILLPIRNALPSGVFSAKERSGDGRTDLKATLAKTGILILADKINPPPLGLLLTCW